MIDPAQATTRARFRSRMPASILVGNSRDEDVGA